MNIDKFDYIIVGSGLSGAIIARKLAEEKGKKILILEKRNHVAGNTFDFDDEHGIKVQKYGPHVFHTNSDEAYNFATMYCDTEPYRTHCEAVIDGISTPSPFNFKTIDQFYDNNTAENLKQLLLKYYDNREEVTVVEMLNAEEPSIRHFAEFLFEKDYKLYTAKQWNLQPDEIDPSVLKRVPIVLSYRDTYFNDKYEFMPKGGFAAFFEKLLDHSNITVQLNFDALPHLKIDEDHGCVLFDGKQANIVYTGPIDELFEYKYGVLPYRSLNFKYVSFDKKSFQNVAIVAYPQADGYTRITEYSKMPIQYSKDCTSVAYEYPVAYDKEAVIGNEPYYPVLTESSQVMYNKYSKNANYISNLTLCGRLAEFKYFNMDQVILRALEVYKLMEVL